ncbi:Leishmanolysin-like peptidase [Schistosoma japonicum]|uniref:Leishmanolysin-like peptidase n=1 Tax=Schistosoma japonicum TaxID=6182 RepID=A0A4Z2CLQ5_SCHJA|nr:Leishmanolysin-like peptidase [Schistosoma japonicum]
MLQQRQINNILNDIFTPVKQHSSLVSRISLAYFKDTKTQINCAYEITYAEYCLREWGFTVVEFNGDRQQSHEDIQPFCDTPKKLRCLSYEKAIGTCTMWKMYRELSSQYQYMDDTFEVPARYRAYYSGSEIYDYCPVYEIVNNTSHFQGLNLLCRSKLTFNVTTNLLLEDLGPNTACFDHSELIKQNVTSIHTISKSSSCHKFECSTGKGLQIIVNEQKFPCSTGSNTANVTFTIQRVTYSMTIFCPPCRSLCKTIIVFLSQL